MFWKAKALTQLFTTIPFIIAHFGKVTETRDVQTQVGKIYMLLT